MTCANEVTKNWYKERREMICEKAELTLVKAKDLPRIPRVLVFISGQIEDEDRVRIRLGRQKHTVIVGNWHLYLKLKRRKTKDKSWPST